MSAEIEERISIVDKYLDSNIKATRACFGEGITEEELDEAEKIKAKLLQISSMSFFADKYTTSMINMKRIVSADHYEYFERRLMSLKTGERSGSADSHTLQQIESVLGYPWGETYQEDRTPSEAKDILINSHYGMEEVKDKILEHLAVSIFLGEENVISAPIICLIGPPGVGKTSIAKSVAAAVGRKFVRISMSGVDDEAVIRGHRRTYVGATAGRIVASIKKAKVENPVMLFDEIDKM